MTTTRLRVVELAQGVAGPALGRILAGFGHDVVKCELPSGDERRGDTGTVAGEGGGISFRTLNAGKRSVVADPGTVPGRDLVARLLDRADVAIADFRPADYEHWGVAPEEVLQRWPRLVWTSLTGFGLDGEHRHLPSDSLLAESFGGLANLIGTNDQRPLSLGGEQAAYAAAFSGLLGTTVGLLRRERTGRGDVIDVALCDTAAFMDWKSEVNYASTGVAPQRADGRGWWRIVKARDGWVGVVYDPSQWDRLVELIDDPRLRDHRLRDQNYRASSIEDWMPVIEAWVAKRTTREAYEEAQRHGLPFGYSADMGMLPHVEQYQIRGFLRDPLDVPAVNAPWQIDGLEWRSGDVPTLGEHDHDVRAELRAAIPHRDVRPTCSATENVRPLEGMIVLDFGTVTAGAAASRILADFGATVVKIEAPDRPDQFRRWAASTGGAVEVDEALGVIPMFEANNAGKYAITLDLKNPSDLKRFYDMVPRADVCVENFRVGVTERLRIDFATLRTLNPDLIYLSLASQGQVGPESRYASYGSTLDLLSGLASVTGYPGGPPTWSSYELNYPDQLASLVGATLVCVAHERGVRGVQIDLAQRELVSWTLADLLAASRLTGTVPEPTGNRRGDPVPHETFPCADAGRWVAITCTTDIQRANLGRLVGNDLEKIEPTLRAWSDRYEDVNTLVGQWSVLHSRSDCTAMLASHGVPGVPVMTAADRAISEHFSRRRVFVQSPGGIRTKGFPFVMGGFRPQLAFQAPRLGEHNDRIEAILGEASALGVPSAVDAVAPSLRRENVNETP